MRLFIALFFLAISSPAFSQIFVNKLDVNKRSVQYVEVWEKYNKDTQKFFAMVDYGQEDDKQDAAGTMLKMTNEEGQMLEFNGVIDIVNYMARNGWEVFHIKTIDKYESYVMRRKDNTVQAKQQFSTTN